jgi:HK97 family phage major capsid protein
MPAATLAPPKKFKTGDTLPVLYRSFEIDSRQIDEGDRTVEICFATETPVERYFGQEILLCRSKNVRLERLQNKGAFLFEHDPEKQIGAHLSARVDPDNKCRATVKFSRSELGEQEFQDVRDGIRTLISVGYIVHKYEVDDEDQVFTATDWEPLENSLVSIPVDTACGVGRSVKDDVSTVPQLTVKQKAKPRSPMKHNDDDEPEPNDEPQPPPPPRPTKFDRESETKKLREKLIADQNEMRKLATKFDMFGGQERLEEALRRGISPQEFQSELVDSFDPEAIRPTPGDHNGGNGHNGGRVTVEWESPGAAFSRSAEYRRSVKFGTMKQPISVDLPKANLRATVTTTGLTSIGRPTGLVELGAQTLTVRDLVAPGTTTNATVRYPREVAIPTFSGALTTSEDAAKKETTFSLAEVDAPVRKIAVIGRVSEEAYSDMSYLQSYIDNRLRFLVQTQEEVQLLTGNGVAPNLQGILTTSGIQTISGATGTTGDNIMIAITNIRSVGFFEPDGIVLHPTDYRKLRLAKDSNNQYFGGGYFMNQYGVGPVQMQPQIWGLRTVITTAMSAGTILVGAFRLGAQIFDREGLRVDTTETDGSDWASNRIAVRVEERLAFAVYRPLAFHTITAIP